MFWVLEENYHEARICSDKKNIHLFEALGDKDEKVQ